MRKCKLHNYMEQNLEQFIQMIKDSGLSDEEKDMFVAKLTDPAISIEEKRTFIATFLGGKIQEIEAEEKAGLQQIFDGADKEIADAEIEARQELEKIQQEVDVTTQSAEHEIDAVLAE